MNGNEKGVDCGGSCPEVCGCFDKVQNPWEEGVDCGGPCVNVCSCFDGVMNNDEEGMDKKPMCDKHDDSNSAIMSHTSCSKFLWMSDRKLYRKAKCR